MLGLRCLLSPVHAICLVLSMSLTLGAEKANASSAVLELEGSPKPCHATFFHFADRADLALVPVKCLENLVTGGITVHGNRSTRVVVHPEVEKQKVLDPTLVKGGYDLAVVAFPTGTAETVMPLAPVAPKVSVAERTELAGTGANAAAAPSITDDEPVSLDSLGLKPGSPVHDALGRVIGIHTVSGESASVHDLGSFELLWHARKKLGAEVANYRIPTVDVQRAELCWLFRKRRCCPQPVCCQPAPQPVCQPTYKYPPAQPVAQAVAQSTRVNQVQTTSQTVNNNPSFNVNPRTVSRSVSSPVVTVSPTITNEPVINFHPTINVPVATGRSTASVTGLSDSLAELRRAEERLYQEREALARQRRQAEESMVQELQRFQQQQKQLQEAAAARAKELQALEEENCRLKKEREAAEARALEEKEALKKAAEEAEKARQEAERLREVARQVTQAALLQQGEVDESKITGREEMARLPKAQPVDYATVFDRTPKAHATPFTPTLGGLVASKSDQLRGTDVVSFGERAFFASLPEGFRTREALVRGAGVSELQLASLVANYHQENSSFARHLAMSPDAATPWWDALPSGDRARAMPARELTREEYLGARRIGADPSYLF